jgi:hypothetical protein
MHLSVTVREHFGRLAESTGVGVKAGAAFVAGAGAGGVAELSGVVEGAGAAGISWARAGVPTIKAAAMRKLFIPSPWYMCEPEHRLRAPNARNAN